MKKTFIGLLSLVALLASCAPKINKDQQEKLEELTLATDTITQIVNSLDSNEVAKTVEIFFTHKDFLQNKMKDTLERDLIFKLDKYLSLRKSMSYLRSEYVNIRSEANIMQQQLIDLNTDVSNRLIDAKKFDTYYELEMKNFQELKNAADKLNRVKEYSIPIFEKNYPFVDSLINAYQQRVNE